MSVDSINPLARPRKQVAEDHVAPHMRRADYDGGRLPELPDSYFYSTAN